MATQPPLQQQPQPQPQLQLQLQPHQQEEEEEEVEVVIIDNGSAFIKAGFAGDEAPRYVFENILGCLRQPGLQVPVGSQPFVGDKFRLNRGMLAHRWPIENGIVTKWDAMEEVWHHACCLLTRWNIQCS